MGAVVREHARRFGREQQPLFASVADAAPFAPTSCAECVLRLSFQMLAARWPHHPALHRWLVAWCAASPPPPPSPLAVSPFPKQLRSAHRAPVPD